MARRFSFLAWLLGRTGSFSSPQQEHRPRFEPTNDARIARLTAAAATRPPQRFQLGDRVWFCDRDERVLGCVDAVFADLEAATDAFVVPPDWYGNLAVRPRSAPSNRWYSVVLPKGAVLAGELDLGANTYPGSLP